ncbi:MAG: FAD-dependent oxidoreductase [Actinobacteria bacterium]|nr:FAD-dependent oxidoreductase [Actinomycetota bacterium]
MVKQMAIINGWELLKPIKVGNKKLKNRMVMAPLENHLNNADGSVSKKLIDYYVERAKGGIGTIIVQNTHVDDQYSNSALSQLGVYSDNLIAGLNELAEAVQAFGTAAFLQLGHGGYQCNPNIAKRQPVAPSAMLSVTTGVTARELTIAEIKEIEDNFAIAARRAKQAGFDGVEIHGAHGYLLSEFLSPYLNHRTDKYGYDRTLLGRRVISKIRNMVGSDFVVGYRITACDFVPGGLVLEDACKAAPMFESEGIDYIHVSAAIYETGYYMSASSYMERANLVELAAGVKQVVGIPVVSVGSHTVETGETALREGKADLVAFARGLLADPELAKKVAEDRIEDIRPCLRSGYPCGKRFAQGLSMRCEVNPACGREEEYRILPAGRKRTVLVVGGGLAGMEAARVAALRGHQVTVLEKGDALGGLLRAASVPDFKVEVGQLLAWLVRQMERGGIDVRLKTEATQDLVIKLNPEVLIVAVGSEYGANRLTASGSVTGVQVLEGERKVGKSAAVVGGGLVGCETALYLAEQGKRITLVEALDELPEAWVNGGLEAGLMLRIEKANITVRTGWHAEEVRDGGVVCLDKHWRNHLIETETVVLAAGLTARTELVESFQNCATEVYAIGDCVEARRIHEASQDAWRVALRI